MHCSSRSEPLCEGVSLRRASAPARLGAAEDGYEGAPCHARTGVRQMIAIAVPSYVALSAEADHVAAERWRWVDYVHPSILGRNRGKQIELSLSLWAVDRH